MELKKTNAAVACALFALVDYFFPNSILYQAEYRPVTSVHGRVVVKGVAWFAEWMLELHYDHDAASCFKL
jgi:hypothetical protein